MAAAGLLWTDQLPGHHANELDVVLLDRKAQANGTS